MQFSTEFMAKRILDMTTCKIMFCFSVSVAWQKSFRSWLVKFNCCSTLLARQAIICLDSFFSTLLLNDLSYGVKL